METPCRNTQIGYIQPENPTKRMENPQPKSIQYEYLTKKMEHNKKQKACRRQQV